MGGGSGGGGARVRKVLGRHRFHEPSMSAASDANSSEVPRLCTAAHAESGSHARSGFSFSDVVACLVISHCTSLAVSSPCPMSTFIASCVEKMMRCRSKRPRVTKVKSVYVMESCRLATRPLRSSACSALSIALLKMKEKAASEYWYMWSIRFIWFIRK